MQLAKKIVLTNNAMTTLGTSKRILEDAILDLHKNDNDNWAIGDIKTTTRTINDPNWHRCDGSYMVANVSNDIKNTLTRQAQIKLQKVTMLDTAPAQYYTRYSDNNYVIIHATYLNSSSTSWDKLFIYTRDSNGNIVANSQKTLRSYSNKYDSMFCYPIIKCGNYYYTVVRYDDESSSGLNTRYWHLYYTTNPTGTWSSRLIWSGGNSYSSFYGLYTNGSQARLELSSYSSGGSSSNPREMVVYTFSGDGSNITSSTYNMTVSLSSGREDGDNIYPIGDGKYAKFKTSYGGIYYKSSFTSNTWTQLNIPSWAYSWQTVAYINGKYYGLFREASSSSNNSMIFATASSITGFSVALANLNHYKFDSGGSYAYDFWGKTNAGLWNVVIESETVDSTTSYKTYLYTLTEKGIKKTYIDDVRWSSYGEGVTNDSSYTAVLHNTQSEYKTSFYFIGLAYPDMTNEPYDAYMKIATH